MTNIGMSKLTGPAIHSFLMVFAKDKALFQDSDVSFPWEVEGEPVHVATLTGSIDVSGIEGALVKYHDDPSDQLALEELLGKRVDLFKPDWDTVAKQVIPRAGISHKGMCQEMVNLYCQFDQTKKYRPRYYAFGDKYGQIGKYFNCHAFSKTIAKAAGATEESYNDLTLAWPGNALDIADLLGEPWKPA